jgi:hypothetical protein
VGAQVTDAVATKALLDSAGVGKWAAHALHRSVGATVNL